ncbi:MAG TPA: undecaprenyl-phosphate glucose phosphotransferase [Puia sp.]|jgi:putative colanic acid biosynthesis UDP-glucose lipid carrier transferase|nr:undecaprenyl-phosphate glucose phosphotransferase [Puia sp.]
MNNRYINLFRSFFVCVDLLALNIVHLFLMNFMHKIPASAGPEYIVLFIVANMIWLLSAYSTALYIDRSNPSFERFTKRTVKCLILFFIGMVLFIFFYHYPFSRLFVLLSFAGFSAILLAARAALIGGSFYMNKMSKVGKKIVIVGYNEVARKLAHNFSMQNRNLMVEGFFEDRELVNELTSLPIIGNIDECVSYAVKNNINEIYSTISPERNTSIYEMAHTAEKSLIRFRFVPDFKFYVNRETHMEYLDEFPILSLRSEPLEDITNSVKKRGFDILFSLFVIIFILSWLVPIMAILIKLNSKGPVFFVQMRSGKDNKQFRCFKFRSLSVNKDAHTRQVTKNDTRITPFGKFLRKTNLDELPQFVNVLMGDMSVVGPRPHMLLHTETFSKIMEEYMIRHFVKPGVTGWAQVNGFRGEIKQPEQLRKRIEHDIWYMENWSLWLDLRVIFLTVYRTIKGDKNAY